MNVRTRCVPALLLLASVFAAAQEGPSPPPVPPIAIHRAAGAITVDGDLSDPGWQGATEVTTFFETNPGDNVEPKVKTVGFLAYDDRYFYAAMRCEDPDPSRIRAPYVDRDNVFSEQDFAGIILDTRNDRKSALEFFVNARGIHDDGVMNEATGSENFSPDLFWDSAARITPDGWEMEMRIPFASLRYSGADPQTWAILFYRNYPREFRYQMFNNRLPRGGNCFICRGVEVTGLTGLPTGGHLIAAPFVTGRKGWEASGGPGGPLEEGAASSDFGLDLKWLPNADHALDLTVNPDFSQVESDTAQIAVNQRFALFYPEKRPFFMEGVDLLETPVNAVYTRTITSPKWGLRATGQFGATAYTVLAAADEGGGSVIIPGPQSSELALQDFSSTAAVIRLRHSLGGSFAGFLVTDRENRGGSYNRVFGPDFQWSPNEKDRVTGQALYALTRTPDRPDLSARWDGGKLSGADLYLNWSHDTRTLSWRLQGQDVSGAFRADDGFVPQAGYRMARGDLQYVFYTGGFFSRISPTAIVKHYWDRDGRTLASNLWPGVDLQGKRSLYAGLYFNQDTTRVGDVLLRRKVLYFEASLSPSLRFARLSASGTVGQDFDYANVKVGNGGDVSLGATFRPGDHLTLQFNGEHQWVNSTRNGRRGRLFTADVARLKGVYTVSARTFLRAIVQLVRVANDPALHPYPVDPREGGLQSSLLYAFRLNWQTVLFLGVGDDQVMNPRGDLLKRGREVFFKVSYAFQR